MSGVCGVYYLDGMVAPGDELARMVALLSRRGPDGQGQWSEGPIGFGHTLLWTLPESTPGQLPFVCPRTGHVITGDVRLDNRDELLAALGLKSEGAVTCDEQVVLAAYIAWGEGCLDRLLGDFAFAIWDSREKSLFGARDQMGVRPFYYHHAPGRLFAFASEPRSILALERVPLQVNEGRIADFLVSQLEGIDKTSTFFKAVYRLPPAHCVRVSPERIYIRRYWSLEPGSELRLPSNEYAEVFLNVFSKAVRCRLRGKGRVGSMLSGGMDSGSIVAVASQLLRQSGGRRLPTFSAISEHATNCVETQAVLAALTMNNLEPRTVHPGQFNEFQPELDQMTWDLDEPFDNQMTLPRVIYLAAHRAGVKAVLDGIDGDTVLSEGNYLARLIQRGCWWTAYVETLEQSRFWGGDFSPVKEFVGNARLAFVPRWLRRFRARRMHGDQQRVQRNVRASAISSEFAKRIDLAARLNVLRQHRPDYLLRDPGHEHILNLEHPYLTVGVERYGRVASAIGVEPRHPFLDLDVLKFCVTLSGAQKLRDGWPKAILRDAMAGRLPEPVRWRRGKQHLGWDFTVAYCRQNIGKEYRVDANWVASRIGDYVRRGLPRSDWRFDCNQSQFDASYDVTHLAVWFDRMRLS